MPDPDCGSDRSEAAVDDCPQSISSLVMLITEACNLRCDYCYLAKRPRTMTEEIARRTVNFAFQAVTDPSDEVSLCFFGGEPLLAPEIIECVCEHALAKGADCDRRVRFSMTTNGTLVDDELLELTQRHAIRTKISLDGIGDAHDRHRKQANGEGSFQLIERNIERLLALPGVTVRMTVAPDTAQFLAASVRWLADAGFREVFFSPVVEADWDSQSLACLVEAYEELWGYQRAHRDRLKISNLVRDRNRLRHSGGGTWGCGAARTMAAVDVDGTLYPCQRFLGYFNRSERHRLGTVHGGLIPERVRRHTDNSRVAKRIGCGLGIYSGDVPEDERACTNCELVSICHASCMAVNELLCGHARVPSGINRILTQIVAGTCLATERADAPMD